MKTKRPLCDWIFLHFVILPMYLLTGAAMIVALVWGANLLTRIAEHTP